VTQWDRAEVKEDCLTLADREKVESRGNSAVDNIQNQLGLVGPSTCAATKYRAAAALATGKAKCFSTAATRGVVVDAACLAREDAEFARSWQRAEERGGCLTTGDLAAIKAIVDGWIDDVAKALEPTPPVVIHIDRDPVVYTLGQQVTRDIEVHTTGALQGTLKVTAFDVDPARVDPNDLPFQGTFPINFSAADAQTSSIAFTPAVSGAYAIVAQVVQPTGASCPVVDRAQATTLLSVRPATLPAGIAENILRPDVSTVDVPAVKTSLDAAVGTGQGVTLTFGGHQVTVTIGSKTATDSGIGGTVPAAVQGGSFYQGQIVRNGVPVPGSLMVIVGWGSSLYAMFRQPDPSDPSIEQTLWVEPLGTSHVAYLHSETIAPTELGEAHHHLPAAQAGLARAAAPTRAKSAAPSRPAAVDPDVYFGIADIYEHVVDNARTQQRLSLFLTWQAILRSEFQNVTPAIDPFPISVTTVFINSWNTLSSVGYGSSCDDNLDKFATDSGTFAKSQRLNILFTDKGSGCGGIAKLGQGTGTSWPSLNRDVYSFNYNTVVLGQEIGHNLDHHEEWTCNESVNGSCVEWMTTDSLGGGAIGIAIEDPHLDVSETWRPAGFLALFSFASPKSCTIMRGSYDNCSSPEARYHRNETRVLRHLAEGIIRVFIRD
jgi:hypothetical protein